MKRILLVIAFVSVCGAQQTQKRIALTANSTVASGEVLRELSKNKKCSGVVLTGDASNADYMLEVGHIAATGKICVDLQNRNSDSACPDKEYSATLFSLKGDVLFQTKTHAYSVVTMPSAMQDVCKAIGKQK